MWLKRHLWGIVVALFVGLCALTPMLLANPYIGAEYQGIEYAPLDDEEIYRARIHEILDGHESVAQAYLFEYKDAGSAVVPISEWLYAIPSFVLGLPNVLLAGEFLLPALLFWLAYLFVRRVTGDELTAIAGGLLTVFSVEFMDYGYMFDLLRGGWPRPLLWNRLVNPIVGAVELMAFLNLLWIVIERRSRVAVLGAGILLALMVGYYFAFGIALALLGVLGLIYMYRREFDIFSRLVQVGIVGLVLTLPYWYIVFHALGTPEAAQRGGMFFTHAPVVNKALLVATLLSAGLYAYARSTRTVQIFARQWIFVFALVAAGWIAFNEQVLTGREIWHHHFVQYAIPLACLAVMIALFHVVREAAPRLWKGSMWAAIAFTTVFAAYSTLSVIPRVDAFESRQVYGILTHWLDSRAPKDCVVLVLEDEEALARFIPAYSHCNVYITTYTFYGVPMERIYHNYFLRMRLFGVTTEMAEEYLRAHEHTVRGTFFIDWNQALMNTDPEWFEAKVTELVQKYGEFVKGDLKEQVSAYRVDYLVAEGKIPAALDTALPSLAEPEIVGPYYVYPFERE